MSSMTNNAMLVLTFMVSTCSARQVDTRAPDMETRAGAPSLASVLSALQLAYQPAQRSRLLGAGSRGAKALSVRMAEEETTLTEEDYLASVEAEKLAEEQRLMEEDPEMYEKIRAIENGMKGSKGDNLAPWMQVDARAIVEDERRREAQAKLWAQNENVYDESKAEMGMTFTQVGYTDVKAAWDAPKRNDFEGLNLERRFPGYGDWDAIIRFDEDKSAYFIAVDPYSNENSFIDLDLPPGKVEYRVVAVEYDGSKTVLQKGGYEVEEQNPGAVQYIGWIFILALLGYGVYSAVTGQVVYN